MTSAQLTLKDCPHVILFQTEYFKLEFDGSSYMHYRILAALFFFLLIPALHLKNSYWQPKKSCFPQKHFCETD